MYLYVLKIYTLKVFIKEAFLFELLPHLSSRCRQCAKYTKYKKVPNFHNTSMIKNENLPKTLCPHVGTQVEPLGPFSREMVQRENSRPMLCFIKADGVS